MCLPASSATASRMLCRTGDKMKTTIKISTSDSLYVRMAKCNRHDDAEFWVNCKWRIRPSIMNVWNATKRTAALVEFKWNWKKNVEQISWHGKDELEQIFQLKLKSHRSCFIGSQKFICNDDFSFLPRVFVVALFLSFRFSCWKLQIANASSLFVAIRRKIELSFARLVECLDFSE